MTAVRLAAYAPNGASQGPLPSPLSIQAGFPLNDVGALTLNYAPDAPRVALLGQPVELALEVSWDKGVTWTEPPSSRFLYLRDGRDPIKTGDAFQVEAAAYVLRLQKGLVGFTGLNGEGQREFITQTPGAILLTLWNEAQARGALAGMTATWTATQDSAGTPWPETVGQVAYEPGKDLLAILQEFADQGLVDFRTQGRSVQVYVADHASGMAADRTTGALPVALRFGRDLTEAPFRRTWEGLADTALVKGDNGTTLERTNAGAISPWGRQETYVTASGVEDTGTLTVIADAALTLTANERTEHTYGLDFGAAAHLPFRDYAPGEYVYAATDGGAPQRMRVRQVTLTRDDAGAVAGNVVLNDRFLEADVLTARRIQKLTQGATQGGTGTTPGTTPGTGPDILAPAKPTGLSATSAAYVESDGRVRSQITLDWNDVTTNADGSVASDVDHYEVRGRWVGLTEWKALGETDLSTWSNSPYDPGEDWEFQVRAVDTVFNRGAWSDPDTVTTAADAVGPLQPAAPTVSSNLATARVAWNGLRATGAAMDPDFSHVTVHVSQVNGFTADATNQIGELGGPGYAIAAPLQYGSTYYARLLPWDTSGNAGTPSAQVAFTVAALVDVSNFPDDAMQDLYARTGRFLDLTADNFSANLIEGSWIKAGALETYHLSVTDRRENMLPNGSQDRDNDNDGRADFWSLVYNNGTATTLSGNTATPISGTRSQRLSIGADTGFTWGMQDAAQYPAVYGGQKVSVRCAIRSDITWPAGKNVFIRVHSTIPTKGPFGIFDADVAWQTAAAVNPQANTVHLLEGTVTIPAGHTKVSVSLGNDTPGTACVVDVDSIELFNGTGDAQITEVGAGKIKTGLLQATERVVAGSLSGARAELNGVGFQAFDASGVKTFEVLGSTGSVYTAGSFTTKAAGANGRVEITAANNPYQSGQLWASLAFHSNNASWDPGLLWAVYGTDTSPATNWGMLSIRSPRLGTRQPASIDLRSEDTTNQTRLTLSANIFTATADTFYLGDAGQARVVLKQVYGGSGSTQGFSFQSPGGKRFEMNFGTLGTNIFRSENESASIEKMTFQAEDYEWALSGSANVSLLPAGNLSSRPNLYVSNGDIGFAWGGGSGQLRVANIGGDGYKPAWASNFAVQSDMTDKTNRTRVKGALEALEAVPVYDYDTPHGMGRKASQVHRNEFRRRKAARAEREAARKAGRRVALPISPDGEDDLDGLEEVPAYRQRGVLAQDLAAVLPDAVVDDDLDGTGMKVDLYALLSTAVAAIQELSAEVATLKAAQN